ncbi:MAG: large-conductance mechanosensitive channel protein MscL [Bacteroidales bacterium]|nr:large-conductance mechanosensitive channel protein MscL [Bacteroidales bacterium]MDD4770500.1 large-conductance mechanosensitive channel protein MscL [Bacteroidales bacterium]
MGKVKLMDDFKAFALKGNVVDMAVGVIIGGAFGKIVTSLVNDVIMPPIGVLLGDVNFKELSWVMVEAVGDQPAVSINYGNFIQVVIDFLIIAWVVFLAIRAMMKMKRKEAAAPAPAPAPPAPSKEEVLLTEIRDLLKK